MTTTTSMPPFTRPAPTFDDVWRVLMETRQRSKELDKCISALGNRLGDFVQEMVKPAAVRLSRYWVQLQ